VFENLILIAVGGACGALMRFGISSGVAAVFGSGFPFGTLVVNVVGSLLIGVLYVFLTERLMGGAGLRALLVVGLLGAFTTFSTFSIETLQLIENGEAARALANVLANVVLCLSACWLGLIMVREL
jgi:fluoride exporter